MTTALPPPASGRYIRQVVGELAAATWTLAVLGFAFETGLVEGMGEPATTAALAGRTGLPAPLVESVLDLLATTGLVRKEGLAFVAEPGMAWCLDGIPRDLVQAEISSNLLQAVHLFESGKRRDVRLGWLHDDPEILQAQGTRSRAVVEAYVSQVFPKLPGLLEAVGGPSPVFLDVGSGVAEISIEMCRRFPALRAVGLDPLDAAVALAEENVARAGLSDRIELRRGRVEDLDDEAMFDVVQVPIVFLPVDVLNKGLARVRTALKPGGWVVLQVIGLPGIDLPPLLRLMYTLCGSEGRPLEHAASALTDAGFEDVMVLPPLPGTPVSYAAGRRAGRTAAGA